MDLLLYVVARVEIIFRASALYSAEMGRGLEVLLDDKSRANFNAIESAVVETAGEEDAADLEGRINAEEDVTTGALNDA